MIKIKTRKCQPVNVTNSDQSYTETIASGGLLVLPDTTIEVNGLSQGSVVAVATLDIQLSNIDGVVTPLSVTQTGNDLSVVLPTTVCPPAIQRSTATLMKTGQTTSYRTGDDGDIEAGRESDFLTLDSAPLHNDGSPTINTTTNRFTDTLGGQTYANDWVLDWSTWNGMTLLGYHRDIMARGTANWNTAIDNSLLNNFGGFSNCRLVNRRELFNLVNDGVGTQVLNYAPFNINTPINISSSTTRSDGAPAQVILFTTYGQTNVTQNKANLQYWMPVRTFNLSTSNILS